MSNQHTWSISDAKTTEGETMIVGGPGQEFGLIAVVTDEADAKQIIADREARADAPQALQVWLGAMPESNGKSNFTAILHKGDVTEGHTIARSEYADRVRYEADRVRYLIGERSEAPDILKYDADCHSGYKPPPREWIPAPKTVGDLVNNLLTMDQDNPIYGAYFLPEDATDRCRVRGVTVSRERVENGRIRLGNVDVPYSTVIWTALEPERSAAMTDAPDRRVYVCYDGFGDHYVSRDPKQHTAICYDEDFAADIVAMCNREGPHTTASTDVPITSLADHPAFRTPPSSGNADAVRDKLANEMRSLGYAEFGDCLSFEAYNTILAALSSAPVAGEIELKVEQGGAGLWYATSDQIPGLLVAEQTHGLALNKVGHMLWNMQKARLLSRHDRLPPQPITGEKL